MSLESRDHNENVNNIKKQEDGNNIEVFETENVQNVYRDDCNYPVNRRIIEGD